VALRADRTAVIVVDMQNDFVDPDGALVTPTAEDTVPSIAKLLQEARKSKVRVVYTQESQVKGDPEFDIWPEHCRIGTWGWKIVDELAPEPVDLVCRKNRYDGFYGTWMDHFLDHVWDVENVVIVGTVANICVLHTAASAGLRYYRVVMPADGISALTDFDRALTLQQVSWLYKGTVVHSSMIFNFRASDF
jgi:nicotinamidase-related amidase